MSWGNENWNTNEWGDLVGANPTGPAANRRTPAEAEQAALLGTDIRFAGDYDVTGKGDYVLIDGETALRQSILHRLMTNPGEFKTRPTYVVGIRKWVKRPKTGTNILALQNQIEDQLARESRIEEVVAVRVRSTDEGLEVSIVIRAAGKTLRYRPFVFNELGERTLDV